MTSEKNTNISTNVYLSLFVKKGSQFQRPDFGCEWVNKISPQSLNLQRQNIINALKWMIKAQRAKKIDVWVEQDLRTYNQMNISITVTQQNGIPITYTLFMPVGGPSPSFVAP
jgi:phage gp46-like protein